MNLLFIFLLLMSGVSLAEGPILQHPTNVQQEFDNVYKDIRNVKNPSYLTVSSSMAATGDIMFGLPAPTNATVTATTGGSLSGTYYYKIWPFTSTGKVSFPSPELVVVVGGGNSAARLSWTAVPGASFYRIGRGTTQGTASAGYYQTTATAYTDTGSAFDGNPVITAGTNEWLKVAGVTQVPCSSGGLNFVDYTDGTVHGHISCTSVGEFEISTGSGTANGHFLFEDAGINQRFYIDVSATPAALIFSDFGAWLPGEIRGSTVTMVAGSNPSRISELSFYANGTMQSFVPLTASGNVTMNNGAFILVDKTLNSAANPGIHLGEANSGFYWVGTNETGMTMAGAQTIDFTTAYTQFFTPIQPLSRTLAQLKTVTPNFAGLMYYCSNCVTDGVCISTGTSAGSVARISARTTACQ